MKKEIGFILFLLVGLAAFVMGVPGLSHAQPNAAEKCHINNGKGKIKKVTADVAGADAVAIFVLKADGSIEVMEGPDQKINFREPRKMKDGQPGAELDKQPNPPTTGNIPDDIKYEMSGMPKVSTIATYVGNTCTNVNGTWYCW